MENDNCPHCGATQEYSVHGRFICGTRVIETRSERGKSCLFSEVYALRAKLAAQGRVGQRRLFKEEVAVCVMEFRNLVYFDHGHATPGIPFYMDIDYWDSLPMADTEGGVP